MTMTTVLKDWRVVQLPDDRGEDGSRYFGKPETRWFLLDSTDLVPIRNRHVIDALDSAYWREVANEAWQRQNERGGQ